MRDYYTISDLAAAATKLRTALDGFELHGDGEHHAVLADLARISTALTSTCAELRQHSKAATREIAKIPLDLLVEYLKTLPDEKRIEVARQITNADAGEALL